MTTTSPIYPERIEYTDEKEVNGEITVLGTTINNEAFQNLNARNEDFNIFQAGHLFKNSGYIEPPVLTISTRTLTLVKQDSYTRYFDHILGFWEIPASTTITLNALTAGVAVDRYDYVYLEIFKYNNAVNDDGELLNGTNTGKIGFRLNVYEGSQPASINTARNITTSVRDTELESDHAIYPLTQIRRLQTTTVAETTPLQLVNISIPAIVNELTFNKIISPEIKALLNSHDFQFVYDWSAIPVYSNNKWASVVHSTAIGSVSNGILYIKSEVGEYVNYYKETGDVKQSDTFVIEHRCKITASTYAPFCMVFMLTESQEVTSGSGTYKAYMVSGKDGKLYIAGGTKTIDLDIDQYHTYTLIKDKNKYYHLFVDGVLVSSLDWSLVPTVTSSVYYNGRNLVFGTYYGSTVYSGEMYSEYFKYSKIREGSKNLYGTDSKVISGSYKAYNQAETRGIEINSTTIKSLGTNQDLIISANGTGSIVPESDNITSFGTTLKRISNVFCSWTGYFPILRGSPSTGSRVVINKNTTANRPVSPYDGEEFFDTTLGKPIWRNGSNWVDSTGTIV